jgi:hemoglobin-like flavoprotein
MTPQQVAFVKSSFSLVQPIATLAASKFYENLFKADPSLKPLFTGNMVHQGERLMSMIGTAVGMLDRPESLVPALRQLGIRHKVYGVRERDYATVGAALLLTLQQGLGDAFTQEVREAWTALYGVISFNMIDAARMSEASIPVQGTATTAAGTNT